MAKIVKLKKEAETDSMEEYQLQVKANVKDPFPYDRLMIHYRKSKEYAEELKIIKLAITVFKEMYAANLDQVLKKFKQSKIKTLSKQINHKMGLVDKKGKELYLPEPLPRWIKRQSLVEEKIKKQPGARKTSSKKKKIDKV